MRFQVSRALDAIEARLRTDPALTGAVVDITEAIRLPGPDGRPVNLLRLGLVVDALSGYLGDESVALYVIGNRGILSDTDLTSNERMALRRWSDDGFIEIIPPGFDAIGRSCEVGWALGQPVITARSLPGFPGSRLLPASTVGNVTLVGAGTGTAPSRGHVLGRWWRCPEQECPSFPLPDGRSPRRLQSPPRMAGPNVPVCPRHQHRLIDCGPCPPAMAIVLRVDGLARYRFTIFADSSLVVGRAPDVPGSIIFGPYLTEEVAPRVSRSHLRLELRDGALVVTDISTNGSFVNFRTERGGASRLEPLTKGQPTPLGEWDVVELAEGVDIGRADRSHGVSVNTQASSVMRDAPTMALRLPKM